MKNSSKLALLAGVLASSAQTIGSSLEYGNPYDGLPELSYSGSKPVRKSNLTKNQKKARAKAKAARKSRKKNRK